MCLIDIPSNEEDIVKFKEYIEPEVSPLEGGAILMTSNVGDTTELGKDIYVYLKKKCEESSNSTYILSDNESLTIQYKHPSASTISSFGVAHAIGDIVTMPNGNKRVLVRLYDWKGSMYYFLDEDGIVES